MENGLIIFVNNLEKGKIKPQLADEIGEEKLLDVYRYLLKYTAEIATTCHCNRFVFYSSYIHIADSFDDHCFTKFLQEGESFRERVKNAFEKVFDLGIKKACIIQSDCSDLTPDVLDDAFRQLDQYDIVLGPTLQGDNYMVGMKKLYPQLFSGANEETDYVLKDIAESAQKMQLKYFTLPQLNTIITLEDLKESSVLNHLQEEEMSPANSVKASEAEL